VREGHEFRQSNKSNTPSQAFIVIYSQNSLVLLILPTLILRETGQDPCTHLFRPRSVIVTRGCGGHDRTAVLYPAVEEQLNGSTV
jgi:hypothetical protein